jgi:hypothetical protein
MVEKAKYDAHVRNQMTARNRDVQTLKVVKLACLLALTRSVGTARQWIVSWGFHVRIFQGCAMAHAVSHQRLTAEARIRSQAHPCRICGGQRATETVSFLEYFGFLC